MPIYGPISGAVFREDFYNIDSVSQNGGVITGTGLANKSYRPSSGGAIQYFSPANYAFRLKAVTVGAVINCSASTGTYRTLLWVGNSVGIPCYQVGLNVNSNKPFYYNGNAYTPAGTFVNGQCSMMWTIDSTTTTFYQNGLSLGTAVATVGSPAETGYGFWVGNWQNLNQTFTEPVKTLQVFGSTFTPAQALYWHQKALETY